MTASMAEGPTQGAQKDSMECIRKPGTDGTFSNLFQDNRKTSRLSPVLRWSLSRAPWMQYISWHES
jgi:hypothetical protein